MTGKVKRRLSTILCADVVGYSHLMEVDEVGTLESLQRCRSAMAKLIERHDGRIINTWGDAVIAEFASVVEAVQCAVEIQTEISDENRELPDDKRMRFRIGINLGDVMVEGDDVYGDGVNVAARLQELAEPGGILISGPVYEQVYNKLTIGFESLGNQSVKNIAHPVLSYRVVQGGAGMHAEKPRNAENPSTVVSPPSARQIEGALAQILNWYSGLPRPVAVLVAVAVFLFLINLFSGLDPIWFHWPVAPMVLLILLWTIFRRKSR